LKLMLVPMGSSADVDCWRLSWRQRRENAIVSERRSPDAAQREGVPAEPGP
jgi:hypothetical protein